MLFLWRWTAREARSYRHSKTWNSAAMKAGRWDSAKPPTWSVLPGELFSSYASVAPSDRPSLSPKCPYPAVDDRAFRGTLFLCASKAFGCLPIFAKRAHEKRICWPTNAIECVSGEFLTVSFSKATSWSRFALVSFFSAISLRMFISLSSSCLFLSKPLISWSKKVTYVPLRSFAGRSGGEWKYFDDGLPLI